MKRLSPEEQLRLARLAEVRERYRIRRKRARTGAGRQKEKRITAVQKAFQRTHNVPRPQQRARMPIMIPENLSLRDNHEETIEAVKMLRDTVLREHSPAQLYFDRLRVLEPAAALLLVAEIFRCRQLRKWRGGHTVLGNYPTKQDVFFQLREMGFFKLLSIDGRDAIADRRPRGNRPFFIRFKTMDSVHPQLAASFCEVVTHGAFEMTELARARMVASLKEAMGNAHEHAYETPAEYDVMKKRWWLAGHLDPVQREMMIMILDQGVGIPRTLQPTAFEQIKAIMKMTWTPTDGNMIAAATELHRTSTGQLGRGRGFQDMKRFVDSCDDGELRVLSNAGSYTYTRGTHAVVDYGTSIGGTLVEWRVKHRGAVVEVE